MHLISSGVADPIGNAAHSVSKAMGIIWYKGVTIVGFNNREGGRRAWIRNGFVMNVDATKSR